MGRSLVLNFSRFKQQVNLLPLYTKGLGGKLLFYITLNTRLSSNNSVYLITFFINFFPAIITIVSGKLITRNRAHYLVFLTGRAGVINYRDYKRNSENETTDIKRV